MLGGLFFGAAALHKERFAGFRRPFGVAYDFAATVFHGYRDELDGGGRALLAERSSNSELECRTDEDKCDHEHGQQISSSNVRKFAPHLSETYLTSLIGFSAPDLTESVDA